MRNVFPSNRLLHRNQSYQPMLGQSNSLEDWNCYSDNRASKLPDDMNELKFN
jgi:hypothetical protein